MTPLSFLIVFRAFGSAGAEPIPLRKERANMHFASVDAGILVDQNVITDSKEPLCLMRLNSDEGTSRKDVHFSSQAE